jgi:hypothetical protein
MNRSDKVLAAEAAGDSILLDTESWTYLSLNRTGAWVWEQLAQERSTTWLIDAARDRFDAPVGVIEADVREFIADLVARRFVVQ